MIRIAIEKIIEWHCHSHMLKVVDKAKKNIILINSSFLNTLSPIIKILSSEYIMEDFEILLETNDALTLKNIHNKTEIMIKRA